MQVDPAISPTVVRKIELLRPVDLLYPTYDGTLLEAREAITKGFRPSGRPDAPYWPFTVPIDWAADPYKDRNWQFQLHAWYLLRPHLTLISAQKDKSLFRPMLDVVLDWHAFHIVRRKHALLSWLDMAVGRRATLLAYLLSAAMNGEFAISEDEMDRLLDLAQAHYSRLVDDTQFKMTNHGFAQVHGLTALCRVIPDADKAAHGLEYASTKFTALLHSQFDDEGVHREHSPEYHLFALNTVKTMLQTGWYFGFTETFALMNKSEKIAPWLIMADGRCIPIGDSAVTGPSEARANRYKSELAALPAMRKFDIGYGIIRSKHGAPKSSQHLLFFMCAHHSLSHKHADDLNVFWHDVGKDILIDPGKFSYTRDQWRDYFLSTRAHNTVEIDDEDSSRLAADAYGSALQVLERTSYGFVAQGEVLHKAQATGHVRQLVYAPQKWLVVIDRLTSAVRHNYTQWFHFAPHFEVGGADGRYSAKSGANVVTVSSAASRPITSVLVKGEIEPRIQGWCSENYNHRVPCPTIGISARGDNITFATVFSLHDVPIDIKIDGNGDVHVAVGDSSIVVPAGDVTAAVVAAGESAPAP